MFGVNKKGFTLVELLAVIVILSMLIMLAIPAITRQMELARKKSFIEDAHTAIETVKNDILAGNKDLSNGDAIFYDKTELNSLLDKKFGKSPFGGSYNIASVKVEVSEDDNGIKNPTYYLCLIDDGENGFGYTKSDEIDIDDIGLGKVEDCDHTSSDGPVDGSFVVTADANGGSMPETTGWELKPGLVPSGRKATKSVDYNAAYGTLPVPTQSGYEFVGWYSSIENYKLTLTINNGTLTLLLKDGANNPVSGAVVIDEEWDVFQGTTDANGKITDTFPEADEWFDLASYLKIKINGKSYVVHDVTGDHTKFEVTTQFEVGVSEITSSTIMKKASNHTIYAFWKKSS